MLIINADDLGKNEASTDNIISCFKNSRITSSSAMMFMKDSERAADLSQQINLDTGLHLNFTTPFSENISNQKILDYHKRVIHFLRRNKFCFLLYNPFLRNAFDYLFQAQFDEFIRLFNNPPSHIDGHHHMHLSSNILIDHIIPDHLHVRRNFTFVKGEKNILNKFYRSIVDKVLRNRYICTDFFFDIQPITDLARLGFIASLSDKFLVELMVHPETSKEYKFLFDENYFLIINKATKIDFRT